MFFGVFCDSELTCIRSALITHVTHRKDDRGGIAAMRIAYVYLFFSPLDVVL